MALDAVPGCKAAANDICTTLKSQVSRRCQDMNVEVDLDAVISRSIGSYACKVVPRCTNLIYRKTSVCIKEQPTPWIISLHCNREIQ